MLLSMTGHMLKGPTRVSLAWSKSNLSVIPRLACTIYHDIHSLICLAQAPYVSVRANSSLHLLCDVFELGKNAYSWLVATCDALWLTCFVRDVPSFHRYMSMSCFLCLGLLLGFHFLFLSSFISGLFCGFFHVSIYCLVWFLALALSLWAENVSSAFIQLLSLYTSCLSV